MENLDLNVSSREVLHLANQFRAIQKVGEALAKMENLEQTVRERTVAAEQSRAEAERAKAEATERTEVATAEIADINRREAEASDNRHGGGAVGYVGRPVTRVNFIRSPGLPATSVARGRADGISTKDAMKPKDAASSSLRPRRAPDPARQSDPTECGRALWSGGGLSLYRLAAGRRALDRHCCRATVSAAWARSWRG